MYLIAGVDPGKTTGIACVDLNGRLIFKDHATSAGIGWVADTINRIGTPVIIASDKPDASPIVRRVNAAFNSRLYCPEREFRLEEKRDTARGVGIKDPHERDAYIAAIAAYRAYSNKFKQIEHIASENGYSNLEEIKAKVIARYSIREAVENRKANRK